MSRGRQRPPGSMALTPDQMELFEANLSVVERAATHLAGVYGVDQDEAISACLIRFIGVVKRYDPSRGSIKTLLWPTLYREVLRCKQRDRTIHIPSHFFQGRISEENARKARRALAVAHLQFDEEREIPLEDPASPDPMGAMITAEEVAELDRLLSLLPTRDRLILRARARKIGLPTLADFFGISKQQVNWIEWRAKSTLRRYVRFSETRLRDP